MSRKIIFYYLFAMVLFISGILGFVFLSFNIYLQTASSASWIFLGILLYHLFTSIPDFQKIGSWISRGFSFWKKAEIASVALAIEGELNSMQEVLNKESEGLAPFPVKVEWLGEQNAESFCDTYKGEVIVRMKEHKYNARNIAWATMDFVSKGMVPYSRPYLDKEMSKAVDFTLVKRLLSKNESSLDCFYREAIVPEMHNQTLNETIQILDNLEKRGIFTRIFLEEIKGVGLDLYPNPDDTARIETREFAESLNHYATRAVGEKEGEPYIKNRIKVCLVLIADPIKVVGGPTPYKLWVASCLANGANNVYVLSRENMNVKALDFANKIGKTLNLELTKIGRFEEIIKDKPREAMCIKLSRKNPI